MRLKIGVALPETGGRPALIAVEVLENTSGVGAQRWHFRVGHVERVESRTVEGAAAAVRSLVGAVTDERPCVAVDTGTPQGVALLRILRDDERWPDELHRVHRYRRTRADTRLFAAVLESYAEGALEFLPRLDHRDDLDRALVLFRGGGAKKAGDELESEDEALVTALALSIVMPGHGTRPPAVFTAGTTS